MTTAIAVTAVTVDIDAPAGRGRHERVARSVGSSTTAAVSVRRRRTMTNQAMFAAQAKESPWEVDGVYCKQPDKGIVGTIQIIN